ncbi:hypothetical protein [Microbacterium sp. SLBN-154]|uniref:pPIWI-associating nuclease domain-containing protein n=1 Tax=Microbacterium sp. SLBN-154 TaxID=2768458 RepID=UPI00190F70FC|nr:hypothetical protein [Microbacterium sp. SLBN-154]
MNLSQLKSQLRQIEQKQRQAISNYNQAARKLNQAVNNYNSAARAHNARVRANQQRLNQELARLRSQPTSTRYPRYTSSVQTVQTSFRRVEATAESGSWADDRGLFDLAESEAANSAAALNSLLAAPESESDEDARLRNTVLTSELNDIDPDLDNRWRGALFSLSPRNPDAARHFCTSAREILTSILSDRAPDAAVKQVLPGFAPTPNGGVSRRAKIHYLLRQTGNDVDGLAEFIDDDIDSVVALFDDFNGGTHGPAGRFDFAQLAALKTRVEGAIQFLHRIVVH